MTTTNEVSLNSLRATWTESERRLYPLATSVPAKYELLIRLARQVANDLSHVESSEDLVPVWDGSVALVTDAAERTGLPLGDLPPEQVAGVAFSLRDSELRSVAHARNQQRAIAEAHQEGETWVRLHETGNLAHGLLDPYSSIDLHLASGAAIVASVEPNPIDGTTNHVLTVIRMDAETGAPVDIDPGIAEIQEHSDSDAFLAARTALIGLIEAH